MKKKTAASCGHFISKEETGWRRNRTACIRHALFVMIFEDKRKLLELYNAISGKHYEDPELLEINTLENAIYMSMKNDLSFLIDTQLSLYEHQSTYSPNLSLRFFFYLSDMFSGMTMRRQPVRDKAGSIASPQVCRLLQWGGGSAGPADPEAL